MDKRINMNKSVFDEDIYADLERMVLFLKEHNKIHGNKRKRLQKIFEMAKTYLLSFEKVNNTILERHLNYWKNRKPKSMNEMLKAI